MDVLRRRYTPVPRREREPLVSDAFENHDRDVPARLLLVLVVLGPDGGHLPPQRGLLLGRRRASPRGELVALHLDLHLGVGLQVLVPLRMVVRAALRRDDDVRVAFGLVDERGGALLPAAAADRGEQQGDGPLPLVAHLTVGLLVTPDVLLAEQHGCLLMSRLPLRPRERGRYS